MKQFISIILILIPCVLYSQDNSKWEILKYFIGSWAGTGSGQPGSSTVEREYSFILNNKFIEVTNKSTYLPQEKNPKGEVHEDLGFLSYDFSKKTFIFRQFHIEGFVSQYIFDSMSSDGKTIIFITEAMENIPPGWRARETYKIINDNEFIETFELSEPGKDFELYSENRFNRK